MATNRKIQLNSLDIKVLKLITEPGKITLVDNEMRFNADIIATKLKEEKTDVKPYALYNSINHLLEEKLIIKVGKAKISGKRPAMIFKLDKDFYESVKDNIKEVKKKQPRKAKKDESIDLKVQMMLGIKKQKEEAGKKISLEVDEIKGILRKFFSAVDEMDRYIHGKPKKK